MNFLPTTLRIVLAALAICFGWGFAALTAQAPAAPTVEAEASSAGAEIDLVNARQPVEGLLTGGQITQEQMEAAAAAGYRTVINLRGPDEPGSWDEASMAEQLGMKFVSIPIASAEDLTEENARRLAEALDEAGGEPTILHCGSGNRVGALLALKAYHVDGKSADEALEIGIAGGLTQLQGTVEEYLATHEP